MTFTTVELFLFWMIMAVSAMFVLTNCMTQSMLKRQGETIAELYKLVDAILFTNPKK